MPGCFITFEGGEGCGKTTQIGILHERLIAVGREVIVTREPGGPPIAEAIRRLLLDPANGAMSPSAELLLYEAARAQHVDERIRPALEAGRIVISDRFADSTTAYQGAGRGLDRQWLRRLHDIATGGLWPDLTIVIDLPVEIGLERAAQTGASDRIENMDLDFHRRVRKGFLAIAEEEPDRVKVVDGLRPVDAVAADIAAIVDTKLGTV